MVTFGWEYYINLFISRNFICSHPTCWSSPSSCSPLRFTHASYLYRKCLVTITFTCHVVQYVQFKQLLLLLIKYHLPTSRPFRLCLAITSFSSLSLLSFPWPCKRPLYLFHSTLPSHIPSYQLFFLFYRYKIFIVSCYYRSIFPLFLIFFSILCIF
jgi:hypothetical protein